MFSTMLGCVCALVDGTPIMSTSDLDQLPPDGFARSRIIREFRQIAEYWSKPSLISPSAPNPSTPISCTQAYTHFKIGLLAFCVSCILSHSHWHKTWFGIGLKHHNHRHAHLSPVKPARESVSARDFSKLVFPLPQSALDLHNFPSTPKSKAGPLSIADVMCTALLLGGIYFKSWQLQNVQFSG